MTKLLLVSAIFAIIVTLKADPIQIHPEVGIRNVVSDDIYYFTDPGHHFRNRADALQFCKESGGDGLASISSKKILTMVRTFLQDGATYWIDGADYGHYMKEDDSDVSFGDISPDNLKLTPRACLGLVKSSTPATTYLQSFDCATANRVLCQLDIS